MLDAELLQVINQIPGAIEKAFTAFIERHPGHGNQKTHGNRFGAGQAKESLRRLKDDKGARESYKKQHRERSASDLSKMSQSDLHRQFSQARTANQRAGIANEMLGRGDWKDSTVASSKTQIPKVRTDELSPRVIGARGKNAVFLDDNGAYGVAPIVLSDGDYVTGAFGKVRRVKPEFAGD